jgi:predicted O-methyltransferase YrrM
VTSPALGLSRALRSSANLIDAAVAQRRLRNAPTDVAAATDFVFSFTCGTVDLAPIQVRSEVERFLELIGRPQRVVELGTAHGGMLFLFTRVATADATLVSVDLPGGLFGGGYPRSWRRLLGSVGRPGQHVHLVRGDSQQEATRAEVGALLGGTADLLLIDADHRYDGVRRDYELYRDLVAPSGLIAFHDVVPGSPAMVGGVPRFWEELKISDLETTEIVEDWAQGGWGLGVVRVR